MRGLLFARVNFSKPENGGIFLKCQGQLNVLKSHFNDVDFLYFLKDGLYLNNKRIIQIPNASMNSKMFLAKFFMLNLGKKISEKLELDSYDFLYFRYCLSSRGLLQFIQYFRNKNLNAKIITEFPTYPYAQEYRGLARRFEYLTDGLFRKKVLLLVDRVAHLGKEKSIYNTPTIPFGNGINIDEFPIAGTKTNWNKLQLIAVGNFNYWHGLDRLVNGIHQYKGPKEIEVKVIGRGWEKTKALSSTLGLKDKFSFFPPMTKEELHKQYAWANFGIGTLAIHRKKVEINQSLKHRAYAARGLNFVFAGTDPGFTSPCSGILNIDESEDPLNIYDILENFNDNRKTIRHHAKLNISWKVQFDQIIDYIKEKNS